MADIKKVAEELFNNHLREVIPERYPYHVQILPGSLDDEVRICVISNFFRRIKNRIQRKEDLWDFVDRHLPPEQSTRLSIIGGYTEEEALDFPFLDHSPWAADGSSDQRKNQKKTGARETSRVSA